jgi:CHAT domain-containing protein
LLIVLWWKGLIGVMYWTHKDKFIIAVTSSGHRPRQQEYQYYGKQLYDWLIAPVKEDLELQGINNLTFIMDAGLRSLPVAALYDGERFLVEDYSVGFMPTFSLTDTSYSDISQSQILAMGATEFEEQDPLPAVGLELELIAQKFPNSPEPLLNSQFTLENFKKARQENTTGIIHLATHANFVEGNFDNSYIQFVDQKVTLSQIQEELNFTDEDNPVELIVLSACQTALGDRNAELGFAGFAVKAGVKSALASLWYVSDAGTLGLMTNFYNHLQTLPVKAQALQKAQISMLRGQTRIENNQVIVGNESFAVSQEFIDVYGDNIPFDLSSPYFWSAFTLIGNPW